MKLEDTKVKDTDREQWKIYVNGANGDMTVQRNNKHRYRVSRRNLTDGQLC